MTAVQIDESANSSAKAWLRALELTAPIVRNPNRVLSDILNEYALRFGDAPALLSDGQSFTYRQLVQRSNRYARWALEQRIGKGDVVGLLLPNQPDYFAVWMGISSVGGVVALLNTNLAGPSLAHCIEVVRPKCIVASRDLAEKLKDALSTKSDIPEIWVHDAQTLSSLRAKIAVDDYPGESLTPGERRAVTIEDRALHIFTSGTTGFPKAANVSHARILQWSFWFAGMTGMQPTDRMYNCLPMYHSIGGVLAPGAALAVGASVAIREKFSASRFWSDVVRWDCTVFQYIGEFCRYLLQAASIEGDPNHRIRLACGNGLSADVWQRFQDRFHVPQVLEFYASTEGGVSLFNAEGKPGAIGRIPPYLAQRFLPALVRINADTGEPFRDADGLCVRCGVDEAGEALGRGIVDLTNLGTRFEGYTDPAASDGKVLRNVFKPGDVWVRTGDLMRKDAKGFFYFVDRIGDTFRWKGENVSTSEVAQIICAFPGVRHAVVYGVAIPGTEGRAGMAAIVADPGFDLAALRKHMIAELPPYARPLFVRFQKDVEMTGTLKYAKTELARRGFGCATTDGPVYFNDPELESFVQLDTALYKRIQSGHVVV